MDDDAQVRELLLKRFGLRVRPEMGQYVLRRLAAAPSDSIPVMGGDARTGVAVRQIIAAAALRDGLQHDTPAGKPR
jgi:hypothetical protein